MKLTENFTLAELVHSDTAIGLGLNNTPNAEQVKNLQSLANGLQAIRNKVGKAVNISSGFRSELLNVAVGGSRTSSHKKGLAADISVRGMSPQQLVDAILSTGVKFDQVIKYATFVHFSVSPTPRGELLTKNPKGGFLKGIV